MGGMPLSTTVKRSSPLRLAARAQKFRATLQNARRTEVDCLQIIFPASIWKSREYRDDRKSDSADSLPLGQTVFGSSLRAVSSKKIRTANHAADWRAHSWLMLATNSDFRREACKADRKPLPTYV